jgi:hypothetical protein
MPVVAAAAIAAAAMLVGGMMQAKSAAKTRKVNALQGGIEKQNELGMQGANTLASGSANAFGQMMNTYGSSIGKEQTLVK